MTMASSEDGQGPSARTNPLEQTDTSQQPSHSYVTTASSTVSGRMSSTVVNTANANARAQAVNAVSALPMAHNSYDELSLIGNGAYGTVYLGRDKLNEGRLVALKKIRITLTDEGVPVNALREIALLKQLEKFEHPNIVKLLDICHGRIERDSRLTLILVFEYVEQDLENFMKNSPPPSLEPQTIKSLMHQVLCGVDFLHTNRIIHRDLKPQNLLVDKYNRVKIADFGLARIYDFHMKLTTMVVTLWYRAPEVLLSNSYATPVDVWSCGCIFAELYRRRPLFEGQTEGDQLQRIFDVIGKPLESEWPKDVSLSLTNFRDHIGRPLVDVVPEISPDGVDLLRKLLKFVPGNRMSAKDALNHPYFRGMTTPRVTSSSSRPALIAPQTSVASSQRIQSSPSPPKCPPSSQIETVTTTLPSTTTSLPSTLTILPSTTINLPETTIDIPPTTTDVPLTTSIPKPGPSSPPPVQISSSIMNASTPISTSSSDQLCSSVIMSTSPSKTPPKSVVVSSPRKCTSKSLIITSPRQPYAKMAALCSSSEYIPKSATTSVHQPVPAFIPSTSSSSIPTVTITQPSSSPLKLSPNIPHVVTSCSISQSFTCRTSSGVTTVVTSTATSVNTTQLSEVSSTDKQCSNNDENNPNAGNSSSNLTNTNNNNINNESSQVSSDVKVPDRIVRGAKRPRSTSDPLS